MLGRLPLVSQREVQDASAFGPGLGKAGVRLAELARLYPKAVQDVQADGEFGGPCHAGGVVALGFPLLDRRVGHVEEPAELLEGQVGSLAEEAHLVPREARGFFGKKALDGFRKSPIVYEYDGVVLAPRDEANFAKDNWKAAAAVQVVVFDPWTSLS